jgi:hypothetical protein
MNRIIYILLILLSISCTKEELEENSGLPILSITDVKIDEHSVTFSSNIDSKLEPDEVGFTWYYGEKLYNFTTTYLLNKSTFSYKLSTGLINQFPYQVRSYSVYDTITSYSNQKLFSVNFQNPVITNIKNLDIGDYSHYTKLFSYNGSIYIYNVSNIKRLSDNGFDIIRSERNLSNSVCITVSQNDLWILGHIYGKKHIEIFSLLDYSIQLFETDIEYKFLVGTNKTCFGIADNMAVDLVTNKTTQISQIAKDAFSNNDNLYITTENNLIKRYDPNLDIFSFETTVPEDDLKFVFSSGSKIYFYNENENDYYGSYYFLTQLFVYDTEQKKWNYCSNVPMLESRGDIVTTQMQGNPYQILFSNDEMYLLKWFPENITLK